MRWLWVLSVAAVTLAAADDVGFAGTITGDTTWSGDVYLAGDLYIAPGATLTLEPGTRVTVSRKDALSRTFVKHGAYYDVEIVVAGTVKVNGASDKPVVFIPEADGSPDEAWSGFVLKKGGALEATDAWVVGARWRFPSAAVLSEDVYAVTETRKRGSAFLPYSGRDATGKGTYFYADGTLIPKEAINANRGYSRWIIAPALTAATIPIAFLGALGSAYVGREGEANAIMITIPVLGFGTGYLIGLGIDTERGVRRARDKWLHEHPDFTPPF
jgi:hypothetical protein